MLAIAQVAQAKQVPFTYFSRALHLREDQDHQRMKQADGNLAHALQLGMQHVELSSEDFKRVAQTRALESVVKLDVPTAKSVWIPQGAAFAQAEEGLAVLAHEINDYVCEHQRSDVGCEFSVVVPSGTGTTAFYLAQHTLPSIRVFAVPCVGDVEYLRHQFQGLASLSPSPSQRTQPIVLRPTLKSRFGRLSWPLFDIYHELLAETQVEFDLLYGCVAWQTLFEDPASLAQVQGAPSDYPREIMYLHTGGVSGNATMLARYNSKRERAQ